MPGVVRPPYGKPTGPLADNGDLIASFITGARTGYSDRFHIEEDTLLVERFVPVAIRLAPGSILIRTDYPDGGAYEFAGMAGLAVMESEPPLATVVALQALGLPAASWDLWSSHGRGEAQAALTACAAGGTGGPYDG